MGLSEHEQKLLDDMERLLYQSEADVVQTSTASQVRLNLRSLVLGIVVVVVGIGVLVGGVAAQMLWLGAIGFAVMLAGVLLAMSKREDAGVSGSSQAGAQAKRPQPKASMTDRMNDRWEQRMDGER